MKHERHNLLIIKKCAEEKENFPIIGNVKNNYPSMTIKDLPSYAKKIEKQWNFSRVNIFYLREKKQYRKR